MHLWDMIRRVRFHVDETHGLGNVNTWLNDTGGTWVNEDIVREMGAAQQYYITAAVAFNPAMWIEHALLSLTAGTEEYNLPDGLERLISVDREDQSGGAPLFDVPMAMRFERKSSTYAPFNIYGNRTWRSLDRNQLRYLPAPTAAVVNGLRVWYIPVVPTFHYGVPQAGTGTSLTMASDTTVKGGQVRGAWDDYFIGCHVTVIYGTGIDQRRQVTDYVGSTRVATLDTALATALDTTSFYQVDPILPENHQELLILRAAHACLAAKNLPTEGVDGLLRQAEDNWELYIQDLTGGGPYFVAAPPGFTEQDF